MSLVLLVFVLFITQSKLQKSHCSLVKKVILATFVTRLIIYVYFVIYNI